MYTNLNQAIVATRQADLASQTHYARRVSRPAPDQTSGNTKVKLLTLATTIAVFALPIAEASARHFNPVS